MPDKIVSRVVIEVLGKPKEHVEEAMKSYIERLKKEIDKCIILCANWK